MGCGFTRLLLSPLCRGGLVGRLGDFLAPPGCLGRLPCVAGGLVTSGLFRACAELLRARRHGARFVDRVLVRCGRLFGFGGRFDPCGQLRFGAAPEGKPFHIEGEFARQRVAVEGAGGGAAENHPGGFEAGGGGHQALPDPSRQRLLHGLGRGRRRRRAREKHPPGVAERKFPGGVADVEERIGAFHAEGGEPGGGQDVTRHEPHLQAAPGEGFNHRHQFFTLDGCDQDSGAFAFGCRDGEIQHAALHVEGQLVLHLEGQCSGDMRAAGERYDVRLKKDLFAGERNGAPGAGMRSRLDPPRREFRACRERRAGFLVRDAFQVPDLDAAAGARQKRQSHVFAPEAYAKKVSHARPFNNPIPRRNRGCARRRVPAISRPLRAGRTPPRALPRTA